MELGIKEHLQKYGETYIPIPDKYIRTIYDLLFNNIISEMQNDVVMYYHGVYYSIEGDALAQHYERNENAIVKHYLMGIEYNNSDAMRKLALHYEYNKNYGDAEKYYLMAIEHNNSEAMNYFAEYYYDMEDYENAMKYWFLAVEHNNFDYADWFLNTQYGHFNVEYVVAYCNKLLNNNSTTAFEYILKYVMNIVDILSVDTVNIIINVPPSNDYTLFSKFKELLV